MRREFLHRLIDELLDRAGGCATRIPSDAREHFGSARREVLLGLRSVIDHALDGSEDDAERQLPGAKKIPLE